MNHSLSQPLVHTILGSTLCLCGFSNSMSFFFCLRFPPGYHMTVSCPIHPLKNLLANTISQKFLLLMTLTVLQSACWKFSGISLNGGLSGVFLMNRPRWWVFRKEDTIETKGPSQHMVSVVCAIHTTYHSGCCYWPSGWGVFVRFLQHKSTLPHTSSWFFHGGSDSKESTCNAGDLGSVPGSGRFPGGGNGNPLQYSCLENRMDRRSWCSTVHGVTKTQTWLSHWTTTNHMRITGRDHIGL